MSHRGLREFSGEEIGNVSIGQLGFDQVTSTGSTGTSGDKSGKSYYCAIKAVMSSTASASTDEIAITAESLQGDDLACAMLPGDIIWGCFNYVNITTNATNKMRLLCYHGKVSE